MVSCDNAFAYRNTAVSILLPALLTHRCSCQHQGNTAILTLQDGICFAPIDISQPLEAQEPFHAVLHKASDELEMPQRHPEPHSGQQLQGAHSMSVRSLSARPQFSSKIKMLQSYLDQHPEVCVIDPIASAAKVGLQCSLQCRNAGWCNNHARLY